MKKFVIEVNSISDLSLSGTDIEFTDLRFKIDAGGLGVRRRRLRSSTTMLLLLWVLLLTRLSRLTPSDCQWFAGSFLLRPIYVDTLAVSCRVLSSLLRSDVLRTTSPRSVSRSVVCSLSRTSTQTSMCKDTLRQHFILSPQLHRISALSDKCVIWFREAPPPTPQATTTVPQVVVTFFTLRLEMAYTISGESFASGPRLFSCPVQFLASPETHSRISFNVTSIITLRHLCTTECMPEIRSSLSRRSPPFFIVKPTSSEKVNVWISMGPAQIFATKSLSNLNFWVHIAQFQNLSASRPSSMFFRVKSRELGLQVLGIAYSLGASKLLKVSSTLCVSVSNPAMDSESIAEFRVVLARSMDCLPSAPLLINSSVKFKQLRFLPPTLSTIMFISVSNSQMESEMKRVSTVSISRLPILLLSGFLEIHLVSRSNIDGYRTVLFRLTGALASVGFPPLFKPFSLGYFNVFLDYLKLFRAVVLRIQVKIIRGSLYFELVSPFNTSILCFIVFMFLLFILPLSLPPVVMFETL